MADLILLKWRAEGSALTQVPVTTAQRRASWAKPCHTCQKSEATAALLDLPSLVVPWKTPPCGCWCILSSLWFALIYLRHFFSHQVLDLNHFHEVVCILSDDCEDVPTILHMMTMMRQFWNISKTCTTNWPFHHCLTYVVLSSLLGNVKILVNLGATFNGVKGELGPVCHRISGLTSFKYEICAFFTNISTTFCRSSSADRKSCSPVDFLSPEKEVARSSWGGRWLFKMVSYHLVYCFIDFSEDFSFFCSLLKFIFLSNS